MKIRFLEASQTEIIERIRSGLDQFNTEKVGSAIKEDLVLAVENNGELIGGLLGGTYWNWLYVEILFIMGQYRGQGLGSKILQMAEEEAIKRGCRWAHLDTHDFQAVDFYKKHGYEIAGILEDLPPGHQKYILKKKLV